MSDEPEIEVTAEDAEVNIEISEDNKIAEADEAPLDPNTALQKALRIAMYHDGLARGLHESVKALDRTEAQMCILSSSCNEPAYVKLITALCKEHGISMLKVQLVLRSQFCHVRLGRELQAVGRVGWSLQAQQGGQGRQGCGLLLRGDQEVGRGDPCSPIPHRACPQGRRLINICVAQVNLHKGNQSLFVVIYCFSGKEPILPPCSWARKKKRGRGEVQQSLPPLSFLHPLGKEQREGV